MEKLTVGVADENLTGMPEILYKYRDYTNSYHKKLLFDTELYFTSADKFNDPYDTSLPFEYKQEQLTEDNIFLKHIQMLEREYPNKSSGEIHAISYEHQRAGTIKDRVLQERYSENVNKDIHKNFGIVSLSSDPTNLLMWSHYGNCHTGFCIGLDTKFIFKNFSPSVHQVMYSDEIPKIDLFEDMMFFFIKLLSTKSKHWEYEKEYRLISRDFVNKSMSLTEWGLKEIYLGAKMPQKDKFELIEILKKQFSRIKIYDCSLSKSEFKVTTMQVY